MEKGLGWHYPAGADTKDAPWNQSDAHHVDCPQHEDNLKDDVPDPECRCESLNEDDGPDWDEVADRARDAREEL